MPWFIPHRDAGINYDRPEDPPNPSLMDLRADPEGRVWTLVHVADEDYRRGVGQTTGLYGRPITGVVRPNLYYDTIIEILDPDTGAIVVSTRLEPKLRFGGHQPYAWSYREDEEGNPYIDLFEIGVNQPSR